MKAYPITAPEIALVAATRGMAGASRGLLLAGFLRPGTRRTLGWTLLAIGATTIPVVMALFGSREPSAHAGCLRRLWQLRKITARHQAMDGNQDPQRPASWRRHRASD